VIDPHGDANDVIKDVPVLSEEDVAKRIGGQEVRAHVAMAHPAQGRYVGPNRRAVLWRDSATILVGVVLALLAARFLLPTGSSAVGSPTPDSTDIVAVDVPSGSLDASAIPTIGLALPSGLIGTPTHPPAITTAPATPTPKPTPTLAPGATPRPTVKPKPTPIVTLPPPPPTATPIVTLPPPPPTATPIVTLPPPPPTATPIVTLPPPPPTATPFPAPTASFTWACQSTGGTIIAFTDTSTPAPGDTITGWSWNFGDGGTSVLQNPTHDYGAITGSPMVSLTVTSGSPSQGTTTLTFTFSC
jgi:PKD domain